jgi:hypothetical protein
MVLDVSESGVGRRQEMTSQSAELSRRLSVAVALVVGLVALALPHGATADEIPPGWAAENMKPVGYSDLDGRNGAFKLAIREVEGKWYLYMGHLWHRGWTIVDVTNPADPQVVKFIPGPENTFTIQMDLHDDLMITAMQPIIAGWTDEPGKPSEEGVLLWDISDPVNPKQLSHWKTGGGGTHRNSYPGGDYAYLAAAMPGYSGAIFVILDVSDPTNPKEAGRWWMPGQKDGEPPTETPAALHGPPVVYGDTAYLGYAPAVVILDISDKSKPELIGRLDMSPPFISARSQAVHSVLPLLNRGLLVSNSEASAENCEDDPLNHMAVIDITDQTKPRLMSLFPLPVPPEDAAYADFCDKGGRFGPHNTNQHWHSPDVQEQGDLVYMTYFNAGLRIFDIRRPRVPKEVGWFIPPQPTTRVGPIPSSVLVTQTEDVLVDRRGNIYITDKQWGLFVVQYTGSGASTSGGGTR